MTAITILLAVLAGGICVFGRYTSAQESRALLQVIAESGGTPEQWRPQLRGDWPEQPNSAGTDIPEKPEARPDDKQAELRFGDGVTFTRDNLMGARFFSVAAVTDTEEMQFLADTSHIYAVDDEEAVQLAGKLYLTGKTSGITGDYRYLLENSTYYFLDVSQARRQNRNLTVIAVLIACAAWLLMLLVTALLSRRAIRPIAENMEKQKRFVTDAGHEIKTPLAIIMANTEAMEMISGENKWTRNIKAQTSRLSGLMQNLLTLSRMDEGFRPAKEELDLSEAVREAWQPFAEPASLRKIDVRLEISQGLEILTDRNQIQQLLSILFDNAVKYTQEGGEIAISLFRDAGKILLQETNTTTQPRLQDPAKLFDRFFRADQARTQKSGGYGIGLSAAQAIAQACGFELTADYPEEGRIRFSVKVLQIRGSRTRELKI